MFNDVPWLPGSGEGVRLVHPKISNEVADKLGVASLRRSLLVRSADSIQLGLTGGGREQRMERRWGRGGERWWRCCCIMTH